MSNSHSGALLACIDRSALGTCSSASIGSGGGGDMASTAGLVVLLALALVGSLSDGLGVLLVLVDSPVKNVIVLEAFTDEEITEDFAEVRVIRLVIKAEGAGVVQVNGELIGEATAEHLGGGGHLLLHNAVVFLLLRSRLQALPGKGATAEVQHDISKGLHVVTAGLFCTSQHR
jgi:hypothetical protein